MEGIMTRSNQPLRPMHVFIVENHPDTLQSFIFYLESEGHSVSCASSLSEALESIPASGCDVLFSDIGLPDGTGWDLLAQLELDRPIYAVAMSGFGMNADRKKSLATGFRHHLIKPITPDQIDEILKEAATPAEADGE
jgi:CheY-like chemotaxis protein